MNNHLHILHLEGTTEDDKINQIANIRLGRLLRELEAQGIAETDYTIVPGFFDKINTKEAIHRGHKKIVRDAKEKGLPRVIIAEDDVVFTNPCSYLYFLSQIPQDYDLFFGVVYAAEINFEHRILNGMSGSHTLYSINERFYDFVLSQHDDLHVDRNLGQYAHLYKYFACNPYMCFQRGGYSFNLKREMYYDRYLDGIKLFGQK